MRRGRGFWVSTIAEFEQSPLTQKSFAQRRGIALATLQWWIAKLRRERASSVSLVPVRVIASTAPTARGEVSADRAIEVELRSGVELRVATGTDLDFPRADPVQHEGGDCAARDEHVLDGPEVLAAENHDRGFRHAVFYSPSVPLLPRAREIRAECHGRDHRRWTTDHQHQPPIPTIAHRLRITVHRATVDREPQTGAPTDEPCIVQPR